MQIYVKETQHANEPGPTLVLVTVRAASLLHLPSCSSQGPWVSAGLGDLFNPVIAIAWAQSPGLYIHSWVGNGLGILPLQREIVVQVLTESRDRDINAPQGETCRALHKISPSPKVKQ